MTVFPKERISNQVSRKVIKVRDTRPSRKQEFGRYLNSIDWSIIESKSTCTEKNHLLVNLINAGFNTLMPIKEKKVHTSDPPWITAELKHLIKLRQRAFHNKHLDSYRHYRNLVNTERQKCRSRFFSSKIKHLKETKPFLWWKEVRQISGMDTASRAEKLLDHLQLDLMAIDSPKTIANRINEALLNPLAQDRTTSANETYDIDEGSSNHL